jgi:DNA topoisomerase IB
VDQDPTRAARAAGLRYLTDEMPGIRRIRKGSAFAYLGPDGKALSDQAEHTIGRMLRGKPANGLLPEETFVVDFLETRERVRSRVF